MLQIAASRRYNSRREFLRLVVSGSVFASVTHFCVSPHRTANASSAVAAFDLAGCLAAAEWVFQQRMKAINGAQLDDVATAAYVAWANSQWAADYAKCVAAAGADVLNKLIQDINFIS